VAVIYTLGETSSVSRLSAVKCFYVMRQTHVLVHPEKTQHL
jgi:hypothetical protein